MKEIDDRFGGIARLYGVANYRLLRQARVAIVGIGGVGSWVAESLARSGVGTIILMDMDDLCITNTNRQIHAMSSTLGQMKVEVMAQRIKDISPETELICLSSFYTAKNCEQLFEMRPDLVVDAIDAMEPKAHLIATCHERNIDVVTCGGAGGRTDASLIKIADITKTQGDPLLISLRRKLRQNYGMSFGENAKDLGIPCVFSREKAVYPTCDGGTSCSRDDGFTGRMACDAGFGSITHITGTFGFFMAGAAIHQILTHQQSQQFQQPNKE
ncbi:MAG: tRNA threonylcarbamoyladenosine dehydratase [Akkermansia sp.]